MLVVTMCFVACMHAMYTLCLSQEMELIQFEKKQLIQQWKSALIGLARRDEALTAATDALR
jgi:hypothetical protein